MYCILKNGKEKKKTGEKPQRTGWFAGCDAVYFDGDGADSVRIGGAHKFGGQEFVVACEGESCGDGDVGTGHDRPRGRAVAEETARASVYEPDEVCQQGGRAEGGREGTGERPDGVCGRESVSVVD